MTTNNGKTYTYVLIIYNDDGYVQILRKTEFKYSSDDYHNPLQQAEVNLITPELYDSYEQGYRDETEYRFNREGYEHVICTWDDFINRIMPDIPKNAEYVVIGGQYVPHYYGSRPTIIGAKRLANKNEEYWDNWQGWHTPQIYSIYNVEFCLTEHYNPNDLYSHWANAIGLPEE